MKTRIFVLFSAVLILGIGIAKVEAGTPSENEVRRIALEVAQQMTLPQLAAGGIDWQAGEWSSYEMSLAIAQGTMVKFVSKDEGDKFWMTLLTKLDFFGQPYQVESKMLIRRADGAILEFYVDGQKQEVPQQDVTLISQEAERITVPAGTFDSIHVKMTVSQDGQTMNVDTWMNPRDVNLDGTIKMVQEGGLMSTTLELTGFGDKNPPTLQ
ncbi:MAG: hypothetical protein HY391_05135 [Deltaproteobacteria bacterium]|nr:hypothetical protein [Deltaproteobacteria bacterium]